MYAALDNGWVVLVQDSNFVIVGAFNNEVNSLTVYHHTLYAGGDFTVSYSFLDGDDVTVNHIAKFIDAGKWLPLGTGTTGSVDAMHEYRGDLVAAGRFYEAGDSNAKNIARWNGFNWYPMMKGISGEYVGALDTFENDLIVGGDFKKADTIKCDGIADWNGISWDTLKHLEIDFVNSILSLNNKLYVTGDITDGFQVWDGTTWSGIDWGGVGAIFASIYFQSHIYVGGDFSQLKDSLNGVAYLDYATPTQGVKSIQPFKIFPNPTNSFISISFNTSQQGYLAITDTYGRILKLFTLSPSSENKLVVVSDLACGVYLLTLQTAEERVSQKIVVER
ncbi:MAG: T9SS type A sorting domain-containing protein [Chitinophagales bacterium]|nr:T9SS type A sorting domain-containing protein [Chitinophagales bacterium]